MNALTQTKPGDVVSVGQAESLLAIIERGSRDPSVDIDKMERLMAMLERVQAREAKVAFDVALAEMQPRLPKISERGRIIVREKLANGKRDGEIQQETPFALWEDINEAIRPLLAEYGFSLLFRTGLSADGRVSVTAVLSRAGHSEETTMILPHDSSGSKNAVQAIGSSTSYGKRYTALALLNITTGGEDDDGLGAVSVQVHEKPGDAPFPQGPAQNKSALKTMARNAWRDVEGAGDQDQLDVVLADNRDIIRQLRAALPSWWDGGERDGNAFEGLGEVISRKQREFAENAA